MKKTKTPTAKELGCPFEVGDKVLVEAVIESIPEPGTMGWNLKMFTVAINAPGGSTGVYGGGKACVPGSMLTKREERK